ncbi:MAG: gfo/Idh/MocA family oxidoreductase [Gammaproteobacteria bacterium]|nr:gfo/Idh/MocA family oxidoreductase [Gammaproteobacteria bacterium]
MKNETKVIQIGLGSMGKRRIRCMHALGIKKIVGFDLRRERREEVSRKYGVITIDSLSKINIKTFDSIIISTPPDRHDPYIDIAIKNKTPAFVEASVVLGRLKVFEKMAKSKKVSIVPSCTLYFHPGIRFISSLAASGCFGKLTNFSYHSGQYLPDWHPFEDLSKYYVSKKTTGAAREIVPFELSWLLPLTGFPKKAYGIKGRTMDVGANIDDTYVAAFSFRNSIFGTLTVDVVSRSATRSLILNFEQGQALWRWDQPWVDVYSAKTSKWARHKYKQGKSADGYNKNISEQMYIDELKAFFDSIKSNKPFPNSLKKDIRILELLEVLESGPQ